MKKLAALIAILGIGAPLVGCTEQQQLDNEIEDVQDAQEDVQESEKDLAEEEQDLQQEQTDDNY